MFVQESSMIQHVSISMVADIVRRRKMFFLFPFLTISVISVIGAYILPKRYESYTTILLEKDQARNPVMDYWTKASMTWNWDNQLSTLNEILFSRTTIRALLDSLGMKPEVNTNDRWDGLIEGMKRQITTALTGNDAFRIMVADRDPFVAKRAAEVLSNIYIQTTLKSERQQAEETVRFLEKKVEELRQEFEAQQREYLGTRQRNLSTQPQEEGALRPQLVRISEELSTVERVLEQQMRSLNQIIYFRENLDNPVVVSQIAALDPSGAGIYVDTLKALSIRYNQLLARYKPRYPQVQAAKKELSELLQKTADALEVEIQNSKSKRLSLQTSRDRMVQDISVSINAGTIASERGSEYLRVKENYETGKQMLDQARVKKELADRGGSRYVILDPAQVPSTPSKPKKGLIVGGGMALGIVVGIAAMFVVEYFDPTIRRKRDIEIFNRPIIGYIP
jgi:uncharacterized protein involved in exopolysaccharide biosynthesis